MLKACCVICSLLASDVPSGLAQTSSPPPLTSNRPGIGESEALVGRGTIQVETGVQAAASDANGESHRSTTWGELTVRVGLTPRIEVFIGWDGLSVDRVQTNGAAARGSLLEVGGNDLRVGAKLALLDEEKHGLTLTMSPAWSFPVGADEFSSGSEDGSMRVLWARTLPNDWSVSGNFLFVRSSNEAGRYWDNNITVSAGRALNSAVSAYAEISAVVLANTPDAWTVDAGLAWVFATDLQWDFSAGHTFANRGDHWVISTGMTIRRRPRPRTPAPTSVLIQPRRAGPLAAGNVRYSRSSSAL